MAGRAKEFRHRRLFQKRQHFAPERLVVTRPPPGTQRAPPPGVPAPRDIAPRACASGPCSSMKWRRHSTSEGVACRVSSRRSQALATFQSRFTVSADTCSASAVSSRLNPPKNRISTTWLFRSSCFASSSSASSSATRSRPGSSESRQVVDQGHPHRRRRRAFAYRFDAREVDEDAPHQPSGHRRGNAPGFAS